MSSQQLQFSIPAAPYVIPSLRHPSGSLHRNFIGGESGDLRSSDIQKMWCAASRQSATSTTSSAKRRRRCRVVAARFAQVAGLDILNQVSTPEIRVVSRDSLLALRPRPVQISLYKNIPLPRDEVHSHGISDTSPSSSRATLHFSLTSQSENHELDRLDAADAEYFPEMSSGSGDAVSKCGDDGRGRVSYSDLIPTRRFLFQHAVKNIRSTVAHSMGVAVIMRGTNRLQI